MKKKLKWIIPLSLALLVVIVTISQLIRFRSSGDVLLNQVFTTSGDTYLLQAREVGAKQVRLSKYVGSRITFSPNGRYLAFSQWGGDGFETLLFDLRHPRRTLLRLGQSVSSLQPLDDGSLLYIESDTLYRATKQQTSLLAENIRSLGAVSGDGAAIYCFRPEADSFALCRMTLSTGSVEVLLEHVDETTLQVVQDENGQDIVICAQAFTYEFSAYDAVHDSLAEADAASTDEAAQTRNALRTRLKERIITTTGKTVWRIAGEDQQRLAEGVQGTYFCDPITGILVYRHCYPFAAPVEIEPLKETYLPVIKQGHFSLMGNAFTPAELNSSLDLLVQFSGDGTVAALLNEVLYVYRAENGTFGEAVTMTDPARDFALLRREEGGSALYYQTTSGLLRRYDGTQDFILSTAVLSAHLPCRVLPNGTRQLIDDRVYIIQYAKTSLRRENLPDTTMSQYIYYRPKETTLFLVSPKGEKTVGANISNNLLKTLAATSDGSILADSGPFYILRPARIDRLRMRYQSYSIRAAWPNTELVTLQ